MTKHFLTAVLFLTLYSSMGLPIDWFPFPRPSSIPSCTVGEVPGGATCVTISHPTPTLAITTSPLVSAVYRGGKRLTMGMGMGQWHMERYRESGVGGMERQRVVVGMGKTTTVAEEVKVVFLKRQGQ